MNTRATEALVQASQGGVARGAQVPGKRIHQAEVGKIASAGFAQILGEQVAKSTPQTDTLTNSGQRFVPNDVPTSPPDTAPTQAPASVSTRPQAPAPPAPEPAPDTGDKTVPQARAQIRFARSEHAPPAAAPALAEKPRHGDNVAPPRTDPAPRVRTERSWLQTEAGTASRAPALPDQGTAVLTGVHDEATRTVEHEAQPSGHASRANMAPLSPARPAKAATTARQSKNETTAIPAARLGQTASRLTDRLQAPANLVVASNSESRSALTVQSRVEPDHIQSAHTQDTVRAPESTLTAPPGTPSPTRAADGQGVTAMATPTKSTGPQSTVHIPARHVEGTLPQPAPATVVPQARQVITHEAPNAPSTPINATRLPVQPGSTALHAQPTATDRSPLVSTKAQEATTPEAPITGRATFAPVQTGSPALHEQSVAADDSPGVSTTAHEATALAPKAGHATAFAPIQSGTPAVHGKSRASENTTRAPAPPSPDIQPAGIPTLSVMPASVGASSAVSTQPGHTAHQPGLPSIADLPQPHTVEKAFHVTPASRQPSAKVSPLATKPTAQAPAVKEGNNSWDAAVVVAPPHAQQLPHHGPAAAPPTSVATLSPEVPASLAQGMPVHDQKEDAPVQVHPPSGHHTVADVPPAQELKPQARPDSIPPPVAAQAPSPSISLPLPTTVAQESAALPVARNPQPTSPPETAHPVAAAKASTRAAASPVSGHPAIVENAKPAESTAQLKTPEPTPTHVVTSSENSAPGTATKPSPPSPDPAATLPAPAPAHAGNKSALHAETLASKQRTHSEDKKEADDTTQTPASSPQANLRPSQASPSAAVEVTAPKSEALQTAEHTHAAATSSQTSSSQSTATQPLAAKEAPHPIVQSTVETPTGFVPPSTLLSTHGESGMREAPAPAPVAVETAGLVDRAVHDPGLSVTVMPHSAHVSIAGDTGDLSLHVRVRDGSADVNVSGTMAPLFDSKAPEMRTALAGEGLQLGSFATDQRGSSQGQQGQPETTPRTHEPFSPPTPRRQTISTPQVQIAADRRIHVKA